jgi:hypothetical protein
MDPGISETHNDRLLELTTIIRQHKRSLGALMSESNLLIQKLDKYQCKREVSIEMRRRYLESFES